MVYKQLNQSFKQNSGVGEMTNQSVQPIFILPEGTQRNTGKSAQNNNIMAAKIVAETVRTTLGPKGMDKMLVDSIGDIIVTNDGVTILKEMDIEHPSAKMIVEIAKTQEEEVGDGTTTAVVLAGELLKNAEELLEMNVHPTIIAKGYRQAAEKANQILEKISEDVKTNDSNTLKKIAMTAMTGKGAEASKEKLAGLVVKAVQEVSEEGENDSIYVNQENIHVEKRVGSSVEESDLVQGIVLDKEKAHPGMPRFVKNAKIALLDIPIEVKSTETDAKISITNPTQMQAFVDMEEEMIKKKVDKVIDSGANVIFCQKGIDDLAQHYLAKAGILAARRVKQSDMQALAKAIGTRIVSALDDLSGDDLGKAGVVEEMKIGEDEMIFVRNCKNPKAVTILLRGGTEHIVDEVKRALEDAIGDTISALQNGKIVGGAGSVEIELSKQLSRFASSSTGREQLAIESFAKAIEIIPKTLAENAGLDPIDVLAELKSSHTKESKKWQGIDVFSGKIIDAWKEGIIEPLKIKTQAVSSASEVAMMILRIDDVIAASTGGSGETGPGPGAGGMPPGMGGMPGM